MTKNSGAYTGSGGKHGVWWKNPLGLVENTGSGGKHGVWCLVENPRGLVENTGSKCKTGGLSGNYGV